MNFHKHFVSPKFVICFYFTLQMACLSNAMTFTGPIVSSAVTVTGDVSVSSMTVSTLTVTNSLIFGTNTIAVVGNVVQMKMSSTTSVTSVSTTSFSEVSGTSQTISLFNPRDYIRVSLSGNFQTIMIDSTTTQLAYITVFRDSTNLGDASYGMSVITRGAISGSGNMEYVRPTGIYFVDSPGDTAVHTYHVFIRSAVAGNVCQFPYSGIGNLILEEVGRD